jgi:hypothetical protein
MQYFYPQDISDWSLQSSKRINLMTSLQNLSFGSFNSAVDVNIPLKANKVNGGQ